MVTVVTAHNWAIALAFMLHLTLDKDRIKAYRKRHSGVSAAPYIEKVASEKI